MFWNRHLRTVQTMEGEKEKMKKCEFNKCSNHQVSENNNCMLYYNISKCSYQDDFECPVVKDNKKRMNEYEAFDNMHDADGIVGISHSSRKL